MKNSRKKVFAASLIVFDIIAILAAVFVLNKKGDSGMDKALEDVQQSQEATAYVQA